MHLAPSNSSSFRFNRSVVEIDRADQIPSSIDPYRNTVKTNFSERRNTWYAGNP